MEIHQLFFYLVAVSYFFASIEGLSRSDFPDGFVFGAGSSAYQYEGAAYQDGKGTSIWDTFTATHPEKILDHSTGNVAEDFYHHIKEDIALMKEIGLDSFRFSISWSRVLPKGKLSGGVNKQGVKFYNELINELLYKGIQPCVTLFHWDTPQILEDEYDGFLSINIVNDYHDYADFCFKEFGDRVKLWTTFNEPNTFSSEGYATGNIAPGRCSNYVGNCTFGNSGIEPYMVAHHILLSHATAVKLYKEKYQASQMGEIGITVSTFGWCLSTKQLLVARLPLELLILHLDAEKDGIPIGEPTPSSWLYIYPRGIQELILYVEKNFNNPPIIITENGFSDVNNNSWTIQDALNDSLRLKYHQLHLSSLLKTTRARINVKGYYIWSFLDDFEWESGYTYRFGINYIDYKNGLTRYMKHTALWFKKFLQRENLTTRVSSLLYSDQ
ncbi:hypothetical protein ACB092_11G259100 [Castanea dentata]